LIASSPLSGNQYHWQINNGSLFADITDNSLYSGGTTDTLTITNAPDSLYGNQYRCKITNNSIITYSPSYSLKFVETWTGAAGTSAWETAGNWSCGSVPDVFTDVIIHSGNVKLNSNTSVRSISISNGASLNISNGYRLIVNH
jgi:hypothetical protein